MVFNLRAFQTGRLMDSERAFWNAVGNVTAGGSSGPIYPSNDTKNCSMDIFVVAAYTGDTTGR